jgi:predicted enzyme related to lactoylglutathione lyase
MKTNPVGWFEIYVQDMGRARKFYEAVLDTHLEAMNMPEIEMCAFPRADDATGASGALVRMEGVPSGGCSTLVYFSCDDCAVPEKRALQHGGRIHKGKESIGEHGFISLVCDSEGNMFGLHSMA